MFVRFVTSNIHPESEVGAGVFTVACELRRTGHLSDYEREELNELLLWFDNNLAAPTRFSRSRRPWAQSKAICWFKPAAEDHIAAMRRLV